MSEAKISVIVVSYNHEKFIASALDSVLAQDGNLIKEILIGDDCSTDKTPEIIESYRQKYPDLITVAPREHNLGVNENYADLFMRAAGEYAAILEGDDYWLPGKLEAMVNAAREHKDALIWYHKFCVQEEDKLEDRAYIYDDDCYVDIDEFIAHNEIQNLSCCMYQTKALQNVCDVFRKESGVDYPLHILILENGPAYFVNKFLSVYRHHASSIWSKLSLEHQLVRSMLRRYEMNELTSKRHNEAFERNIDSMLNYLVRLRSAHRPKKPLKPEKNHRCYNVLGIKIKIKRKTG